jgi:ABC-type cobalamin/Fe3+-siderophores transport system ATPase subunit
VPFELKQISFAYDGKPVFGTLSLTLYPGKFYGILGPNGCGKTTLLDLLMRHQLPDAGEILFQENALVSYPRKALSRKVALVPQEYDIRFPFTTQEVVMMGRYPYLPRFCRPSEKDTAMVDAVLKKTQTEEMKDRLVTELSSGERQRVVFARALAQDTEVLLLDEATSHLDIEHALALLELAAGGVRRDEKTIVAVFHDLNLAAAFCDELLLIRDGGVFSQGPVAEVLTSENIKAVFNVPSKVIFDPDAGGHRVTFMREQRRFQQ